MNMQEMREALAAFKGCRQYLGLWLQPSKKRFICNALDLWSHRTGKSSTAAIGIVERSIAPHYTYENWADDKDGGEITDEAALRGRREFIRRCIAELEKRLAA